MLLMMFRLGCVVFGFRCRFFHFLRFGFFVHTLLFRMHFVFAVCRSDRSQYQAGSRNHQRGHLNQFFHIYLLSRCWFEVKIKNLFALKRWTNINGFNCQLLSAFGEICSKFGNRSMATQWCSKVLKVYRQFWQNVFTHFPNDKKREPFDSRFFQTASIIFCRLLLLQSRHLQRRRLS